eukprot:Em0008g130a
MGERSREDEMALGSLNRKGANCLYESDAARENYGECVKALKKRFAPDSRKDLYVAELNTRTKRREEDWASFGDSLRVLSDRASQTLRTSAGTLSPKSIFCHRLTTRRLPSA